MYNDYLIAASLYISQFQWAIKFNCFFLKTSVLSALTSATTADLILRDLVSQILRGDQICNIQNLKICTETKLGLQHAILKLQDYTSSKSVVIFKNIRSV